MKELCLALILCLGFQNLNAKCSSYGMQFFPQQKTIGTDPMLIVQGYANSQKTIQSFKSRKVYLESDKGEKIKLQIEEILIGQKHLTQAILRPVKRLQHNTSYYFKVENPTSEEKQILFQWNSTSRKREIPYWTTGTRASVDVLSEDLNIEYQKNELEYFGCGPAAHAIFKVKANTSEETWYKTEVLNLSNGESTIFYLKASNGVLKVGHGMCSGAFTFTRTGKYKARFTPMNTDGQAIAQTQWINFKSPFTNRNPFRF